MAMMVRGEVKNLIMLDSKITECLLSIKAIEINTWGKG